MRRVTALEFWTVKKQAVACTGSPMGIEGNVANLQPRRCGFSFSQGELRSKEYHQNIAKEKLNIHSTVSSTLSYGSVRS